MITGWSLRVPKETTEDGWTRVTSAGVFEQILNLDIWTRQPTSWMSQAHYIFSRGQVPSHVEDCFLVECIRFRLAISANREVPSGFLFLCPKQDFYQGASSPCWPACPAYWSLDPSGADRLSPDEAAALGFPAFQLETEVSLRSWDSSVYAGLRQFHQAKGFDPDTQDLARHLGHPLYQLSSEMDPLFAHDSHSEDDRDKFSMDLSW
ncbi:hypothetical protein MVEN_00012400 [Mycena venus]|uniref:Uncharacterized protein n=1 Tax=Mycena venus TaxID=2733690 RepID=A0A8H6Z862_9AGAR|nr:hypothetical protein MVEN_00012400 [Mycena venus]